MGLISVLSVLAAGKNPENSKNLAANPKYRP